LPGSRFITGTREKLIDYLAEEYLDDFCYHRRMEIIAQNLILQAFDSLGCDLLDWHGDRKSEKSHTRSIPN
jgi:hypothetical protein